jgi:hypothetical protein
MSDRAPITHDLKTWPEYFQVVKSGEKRFEVRAADRDFRVGDTLRLREYDPKAETYSGDECSFTVSYILGTWSPLGIPGLVVMSLALPSPDVGGGSSIHQPSYDAGYEQGSFDASQDPGHQPCGSQPDLAVGATAALAGGPKPDIAGEAMQWVERAYRIFQHNPDGQNYTRWNMQVAYCAGHEAAMRVSPTPPTPVSIDDGNASSEQVETAVALMRMALNQDDFSTAKAIIKAAIDFAANDEEALAEGRALAPAALNPTVGEGE